MGEILTGGLLLLAQAGFLDSPGPLARDGTPAPVMAGVSSFIVIKPSSHMLIGPSLMETVRQLKWFWVQAKLIAEALQDTKQLALGSNWRLNLTHSPPCN